MSTASNSVGTLHRTKQYVSGLLGRLPCIHAHLEHFRDNIYENCELAFPWLIAPGQAGLFFGMEQNQEYLLHFIRLKFFAILPKKIPAQRFLLCPNHSW